MATRELEWKEQSAEEWKSPLRKLTRFFVGSRDRWKAKYRALKYECKLLGKSGAGRREEPREVAAGRPTGPRATTPVAARAGGVQKIRGRLSQPHPPQARCFSRTSWRWPRPTPGPNFGGPSTGTPGIIRTAWG